MVWFSDEPMLASRNVGYQTVLDHVLVFLLSLSSVTLVVQVTINRMRSVVNRPSVVRESASGQPQLRHTQPEPSIGPS
jgi:hypothetical protein